jgi:hypothetical protein
MLSEQLTLLENQPNHFYGMMSAFGRAHRQTSPIAKIAVPHNRPVLLEDPLSEGCVFGRDGWGWWPPKLPVFVEHDDVASMHNCINTEARFRTLLTQGGAEGLELARV